MVTLCASVALYSLIGHADKQLSDLLFKLQLGVFIAWCFAVGMLEVFAVLFKLVMS